MFSKAIEPGTTFIDIGANVGLVSVPLGCMVRDCKGIAVEPIERNVNALARNLALNSLTSNISVFPVALGDNVGTVQMSRDHNYGGSTGNAKVVTAAKTSTSNNEVSVQLLDNVWSESGAPIVSFIKIDVEGYEYQVLSGGLELVRTCRPVIYGEFHSKLMPQFGYDFCDVLRLFEQYDYVVCQYVSDDELVELTNPGCTVGNAFFIPAELKCKFPIRARQ